MERSRNAHLTILTTALAVCILTLGASGQTTTVTLTPAPTSLAFTYVSGNALPATQTLAVKASAGTPNYTVTISGTNSLWLTATPDSGKMPASLSVRVNPTGMPVGTYSANVVVTAVGVTATTSIPVTLTVTSPLPNLSLSTTLLSFTSPPLQPLSQTIKLTTNSGPIAFTATSSGGTWLSIAPTSGVVVLGQQTIITVTVDASALVPQSTVYTGKITIVATGVSAANKTQNVTVTLAANPSTPTITSIWPPSVQMNSPATTVTIRGTNFYSSTVMKIVGVTTPLSTTVRSATVLEAVVPATSLGSATILNLIASNPAPGGDSPASPFQVVSTPVVQAAVSAASNSGTGVSPGELITLYGANIGPIYPIGLTDGDSNGIVDTTVSSVSVTIDGVAAPLLYASQNQISVQVPYEATIGTAKAISVVNGLYTAQGTVDIIATAPAIFSLDGSGIGQAAALNYNATTGVYTVNQASNPAKLGDTVILYLTGEGDYALMLQPRTGLLVPPYLSPLPEVTPQPTVTIGGATATVQYAGPMPGSIMGLLQLNVTVPSGATVGTAVPVSVTIGGNSTPTGITLSIHQ